MDRPTAMLAKKMLRSEEEHGLIDDKTRKDYYIHCSSYVRFGALLYGPRR